MFKERRVRSHQAHERTIAFLRGRYEAALDSVEYWNRQADRRGGPAALVAALRLKEAEIDAGYAKARLDEALERLTEPPA